MAGEDKVLAVQPQGNQDIMVTDKDLELVIAEADKRVEILKKVLGVAIKRTNPKDWVDQQGHPYLTASGAEKIAPLFGVKMDRLSEKREEREDDKGKYYIYTFLATFAWRGGSIEAIGTCSSRDKFFSWDSNKKEWKALSEFDETNIKKAAYSNLMVNGITRVLGIRNLTWDDLEQNGIKKDEVAKVEYKSSSPEASSDEKKKQDEIAKMLLQISEGNQKKAVDLLVTLTKFEGKDGKEVSGVSHPNRLTGKRLDIAYGNCKKEYENTFGKEWKNGTNSQ